MKSNQKADIEIGAEADHDLSSDREQDERIAFPKLSTDALVNSKLMIHDKLHYHGLS